MNTVVRSPSSGSNWQMSGATATSVSTTPTGRPASSRHMRSCGRPWSSSLPETLRLHRLTGAISRDGAEAEELGRPGQSRRKACATAPAGSPTSKRTRRRASITPTGARMAMTSDEAWRLDELREEARYRRERLELYRARMYGGRSRSEYRLREYERASQGASARLRRAEEAASDPEERTGRAT